jgi:hypothetical protein
MRRFLSFAAVAACAAATAFAAGEQGNWRYFQDVQIKTVRPVRVKLDYGILNGAADNFTDLRVFGPDGTEIPYILFPSAAQPQKPQQNAHFSISTQRTETDILLDCPAGESLRGITLATNSDDFIKGVSVKYSKDATDWKLIARARPIFRQSGGRENISIDLPRGYYPHLQAVIDDATSSPITITGVAMQTDGGDPAGLETIALKNFTSVAAKGRKDYTFVLPAKNLYVHDIKLISPDRVFSRVVSASAGSDASSGSSRVIGLGSATIYSMFMQGSPLVQRTSLPVRRRLDGANTITLSVAEPPGHSFTLSRIEVRVLPAFAAFTPKKAGAYAIASGNATAALPQYRHESDKQQNDMGKFTLVPAGKTRENINFSTTGTAIPAADTGAAIDTKNWSHRSAIAPQTQGVQYFELTPEVLSHAARNLSDLRLVADGKQVPYLIDTEKISHRITPRADKQNPDSKENISLWQLTFQYPNLPLTELSCATPDIPFTRDITAYEYTTGPSVERQKRILGHAQWTRSPGQTDSRYLLSITRPQSERIFLEVQDGDNTPLDLSDFSAYYATSRLVFQTAQPRNVFLYYGNASASMPDYDLKLSSDSIAKAGKTAVRLLPEEKSGSGWSEETAKKAGRTGFWFVLILVAAGLIAAIMKLLPPKKQSL